MIIGPYTPYASRWPSLVNLHGQSFAERKEARRKHFEENVKGWRLRDCTACNGSGRYDSFRSPKCGGCNGTGKERYKPKETP